MDIKGKTFRHKKRGTEYRVFGTAKLFLRYPNEVLCDMQHMLVFQSVDKLFIHSDLQRSDLSTHGMDVYLLQVSPGDVLINGDIFVLYTDSDNVSWARKYSEFMDGRFEEVSTTESEQSLNSLFPKMKLTSLKSCWTTGNVVEDLGRNGFRGSANISPT